MPPGEQTNPTPLQQAQAKESINRWTIVSTKLCIIAFLPVFTCASIIVPLAFDVMSRNEPDDVVLASVIWSIPSLLLACGMLAAYQNLRVLTYWKTHLVLMICNVVLFLVQAFGFIHTVTTT